jgi:hypothetical protein
MLETDYYSWIVTHNVTGYNPTMKKLGKRLTAELTGFVGDRTPPALMLSLKVVDSLWILWTL